MAPVSIMLPRLARGPAEIIPGRNCRGGAFQCDSDPRPMISVSGGARRRDGRRGGRPSALSRTLPLATGHPAPAAQPQVTNVSVTCLGLILAAPAQRLGAATFGACLLRMPTGAVTSRLPSKAALLPTSVFLKKEINGKSHVFSCSRAPLRPCGSGYHSYFLLKEHRSFFNFDGEV